MTATRRRLRLRWAVLASLVLLVLLAGSFYYVADQAVSRARRQVTVPPVSASPQQVVRTYLEAVDAHDTRAINQIVTLHFGKAGPGWGLLGRLVEGDETWPANVKHLRPVRILAPEACDASDLSAQGHRQCVVVGANFDLVQYQWSPLNDGVNELDYWLVRDSSDQRWLINDEGH